MGFTRPRALQGPRLPPLLTVLHLCSASYSFSFPHADSDSMSADTQLVLLSNKPWAQGLTDAFVWDMGTFLQCAHFYPLYLCGQITQASTIKTQLLYTLTHC